MNYHDKGKAFWLRCATKTRFMVNTGWFWNRFALLLVAGFLVETMIVLSVRTLGAERWWMWTIFPAWLAVSAIEAIRWSRSRFIGTEASLSRIDVACRLHNRLVSAYAGVGVWPQIPDQVSSVTFLPVQWRWRTFFIPVLTIALAVSMAIWLPVSRVEKTESAIKHEPPGWAAVSSITENEQMREIVEEKAIDEIREQLSQLQQQPQEEWYRQGSMEATEHLRNQVERDVRHLQQSLENGAALISAAEARKEQLNQSQLDELDESLRKELEQLGLGSLPMNEELLSQLKKLDLSQIKQISSATLRELEQQLKDQANAVLIGMVKAGMADGEGPGTGGVNRGPGTLPLGLNEEESDVAPAVPAALSNTDLSRAALGDTIELANGRHEVDKKSYQGLLASGAAASPGSEGEVTWRQSVVPAEQKVLKQYFK